MRSALVVSLYFMGCQSAPSSTADAGLPRDAAITLDVVGSACTAPPGPFAPLRTRCGNLVDASGRSVVLFGVNARIEGVFDIELGPGRVPLQTLPTFDASDARRMRSAGFNVLRVPIQWSGVEPTESGGFRGAYLDRVSGVVSLCREAGLMVLLDFHQDAYSKEIGEDGAPLWAIVPPPERLLEGPLTDLAARRFSPQVARAFGTFFGDGAEGDRLRARFARMAAAVAARFRGDSTVIGYEVFNEPVATDPQVRRLNVLVAEALRAADPGHLIFFEPDVTSRQVLDRSPRPAAPFPVAGSVYAPHTYPLAFTGTESQRMSFTADTLAPSVRSAREEAGLWGAPLVITEWGYDPAGIRARDYYDAMQEVQGRYGASSMLWLWKERSQGSWGLHLWNEARGAWDERPEVFRWIARPRPVAVAGDLIDWHWDGVASTLTVRYEPRREVSAEHELYLPLPEGASSWSLRCDGVTTPALAATEGLVRLRCDQGARSVTATASR